MDEVAVGGRVGAEREGDGLGGEVGPRVAADDDGRPDRPLAAVGHGDRAAQGTGRPRVVGDDRQGRGDHRDGGGARHRRRHARGHRLSAVDALAVMAHRAVDRHQTGGLGGAAGREDAEGGRAHRQAVAPGVPVLGGDGGREAATQVLQRAALAEARAPEGAFVPVRDPLVPGRLDMGRGEGGAVPGQQEAREDRVLGVVRAGGLVGDVTGDTAPAGADLGGLHVLGRGPEGVTHRQAEQGAAGPLA